MKQFSSHDIENIKQYVNIWDNSSSRKGNFIVILLLKYLSGSCFLVQEYEAYHIVISFSFVCMEVLVIRHEHLFYGDFGHS